VNLSEQTIFNNLILGWFILAAVTFILLFFITAPYGRYSRNNWGPTIDNRIGWLIMEAPAPLAFAVFFSLGSNPVTLATVALFLMWEAHYIHRAFIYPFSLHGQTMRMTIIVVALAFMFNAVNGYLNGRYIFTLSDGYSSNWLVDARFIVGLLLFIAGFVINRRADLALRSLRKPGEGDYKIPYGEMYRWISCPNYLGEILTWTGWAVATWSLPGLAFAAWTIANLVPRAKAHHRWYHENFASYPPERKALVPWLW
jgi:3-oxo-5-alpha-steroid 4-dehydrogenase 1